MPESWAQVLFPISNLMMIVNSSVNFIVYCFVGHTFRRELCRTLGLRATGSGRYYSAVPASEMSRRPSASKITDVTTAAAAAAIAANGRLSTAAAALRQQRLQQQEREMQQQQREKEQQMVSDFSSSKLSSYNLVVSDGDNEGKDVAAAVAVVVINNANNVIVNDAVSNGGSAQASGPHTSSMKSKADPNGEVINSDAIEMCK